MPPLNTAHGIEYAIRVHKDNPDELVRARAAAALLFHSKGVGWRKAQRLHFRANQLLSMLRNKSIARVVHPD